MRRFLYYWHKAIQFNIQLAIVYIFLLLFLQPLKSGVVNEDCCNIQHYKEIQISPPKHVTKIGLEQVNPFLDVMTSPPKEYRVDQQCMSDCLLKNYPEKFCFTECSIK